MTPPIPEDLRRQVERIASLSQWERAQVGRELRRNGWTYREIALIVSAAKSTISGWCRDIELTDGQIAAIKSRTGSQRGIPRDTQWRRRQAREQLRVAASESVGHLIDDRDWLGGTILYWAEGFKTENALGLANSDPDLLRVFIQWSVQYHDGDAEFRIKLNLHAGNDERRAIAFWASQLGLGTESFLKTYIKPDGTGHRRNHLQHGVAQVRMRRSTDAFVRTMGWIDGLRRDWHPCAGIV